MYDQIKIFNELESEVRSYCRSFPAVFCKAYDCWIYDSSGKKYLDFLSGAGSLNYGHNDPDLIAAAIGYLQSNGVLHTLDNFSEAKAEFLETLNDKILKPKDLDYKVQFTGPTGTDAVEAALKLARKITGRNTVACFSGAYHGVSLGSLTLTADASKRALSGVQVPGVLRLPYDGFLELNCAQQIQLIEDLLTKPGSGNDLPAAIIFETIQGEGGINVATQEWVQGLSRVAGRIGALLIVDDIQAGCGRSGDFFSFESFGIYPDIVCLSKSLSGLGLPLSINLIARDLDQWSPGDHTGTFRGNTLAMVSATAAINKFWSNNKLQKDVQKKHAQIAKLLKSEISSKEFLFDGRGLMLGIKFSDTSMAEKLSRKLFEKGIIAEVCGPQSETLKLMPSLTIDMEILSEGIATVVDTFRELRHQVSIMPKKNYSRKVCRQELIG